MHFCISPGSRCHHRYKVTQRTCNQPATILPMIAVANIWLSFFTPQYGLIEQIASARLEKRVHYQ